MATWPATTFAVTAGWGHHGSGDAVMPGQGRIVERDYTADERAALSDILPTLGETTYDIYLNERAYWRNVPAAVWNYQLGGYQVLKKWLSYREHARPEPPANGGGSAGVCGDGAAGGGGVELGKRRVSERLYL